MQTYWLTGAKGVYVEHAAILESKNELLENDVLSDYHPTMYELNDRKPSLTNVINKLPSSHDQCPFTGFKPTSFI